MSLYNRFVSLMLVLFAVFFSSIASASPRNINAKNNQAVKFEFQIESLLAQKALTEKAYQRLLKISEQKEEHRKLAKAATTKPRLIKASFKAESKKSTVNYNRRLKVTATAYTSHVNQTDSTPNIAAWGDRLKPGMKVIAVSRDLLSVYGLKHKQKVKIKGLEGEYLVLDKMNKRWRKKIDIYMGMDKKKAFRWGRRKVEIHWES